MDKKHIKNINMTNREMMNDVLNEINKMGYTIMNKIFTDTYFLFEGDEDSICEFEIKEIPGFKFALWNVSGMDKIEYQIKKYGIGYTWADSLDIDPRTDIIFFTQYKRDLDKFKPSRSGFVWGLYRDSWQEDNDKDEIVVVEQWRELYEIENILKYMKQHRYKAIEYCGRQSRYIWDDNINSFKAYRQFVFDWMYEYKSRFKKWLKHEKLIIQSKRLLKKIKMSYGILIEREKGWYPRLNIIVRRKPEIEIKQYVKEQRLLDEFESKHCNELDIRQYDIDITLSDLKEKDMIADKELKDEFIKFINNIEKDDEVESRIIYRNTEEMV